MPKPTGAINKYGQLDEYTPEEIAAGAHRKRVGAYWDQIGQLQFDFLVKQGLTPESKLLDVGCGSLRGGIHFIRYLNQGNYYGIDVDPALVKAGLEYELPAVGLSDRLPEDHLRVTTRFNANFGVNFQFALAQSVFTHLPLNHIRLCLFRVAKVMPPGGRFYATFFEAPADEPFDKPYNKRYPEQDPYQYRPYELEWAANVAGWKFRNLGEWGHPRGQRMAEYRRVVSPADAVQRVRRKAKRMVRGAASRS
ncbi:class I SAM-dependent methyltransferase [Streptomonospora algeriensis]|uniref:Class I SAM-dependent methyltransferase n=1 Tax=Streptomonospora algeriensis TaxID=995084 RepID=A0ABW3BD58_9ACTN